MPKIPSATRIQRDVPSGQQGVVNMPVVDNGMTSFGEDLNTVSRNLDSVDKAHRQGALDEADLAMANALEKEKHAYDQDPDFSTIGDRSETNINDAFGTIGSTIVNARDRARWEKSQQVNLTRARNHLSGVSWVKQRDHGRAGIDSMAEETREMALTGDAGAATSMFDRRMESAVAQNYITAQEAEKMSSDFKTSVAQGRLTMMEPEQRIEALKKPWAKNLPSDTRVKLQREAENELLKSVAVSNTDALDMTAPRSENQAVIDGIEDPAERMATEARYNSEKAAYDAGVQENQLNLFNDLSLWVDPQVGGHKYDDIPVHKLEELTPTQRGNLKALSTPVSRKISDPDTYDRATAMAANGDWRGLQMHLANFGSNLTDSDREKFSDGAAKGMAPSSVADKVIIESLITGDSKAEKAGRKTLLTRIGNWKNEFVNTYGKEPTQLEIEAEVKRRSKPVRNADGGWNFGGSTVPYTVDDDTQRTDLLWNVHLEQLREEDSEAYHDTFTYFRRRGLSTEDRMEFSATYEKQIYINDLKARQNPEIQSVIEDVNEGFVEREIFTPTQDQWLDAVSKLAGARRATQP